MLPVARGAKGHPPIPPTEASNRVDAGLESGERVREAVVARVVQVDPDRDAEGPDAAHEVAHLPRHADADGVRHDDLVRSDARHSAGELGHAAGVDRALERAAEGRTDRHGRPYPVGLRALDDPLRGGHSLLDGGACVAAVELLGGREGEVHLVEPALPEPVVAALVECEAGIDHRVAPVERRNHLLRAGHLRHVPGADEADRLDPRHTGRCETIDQIRPHVGRERDGLVLKAVPRADVADRDPHTTPSSRSASSSDAERPSRPQ